MPTFKLFMENIPIESRKVLFDISRLLRSHRRDFATGVDRIDLEIGLNLISQFGNDCSFLFAGQEGMAILDNATGREALTLLDEKWNAGKTDPQIAGRLQRLLFKARLHAVLRRRSVNTVDADTTYVVASHSGLGKVKGAMRRLDPAARMKRFVYIHDIIPLEMPEYQRPETRPAFEAYLNELTDAPLTIASNSQDTDRRVAALAAERRWNIERFLVMMPDLRITAETEPVIRREIIDYLADARPFFTVLGTIEPRKNHLLLLNLWRQMAGENASPPRLCIIGKRGWENENVLDMLDRCDAIRPSVQEFGNLSDGEVQTLMMASRALLFPSFIEGLGIPLLEAAAMNLPCIASDLPVFREIAPENTVFLDPLDGPGWKAAIMSHISDSRELAG